MMKGTQCLCLQKLDFTHIKTEQEILIRIKIKGNAHSDNQMHSVSIQVMHILINS